MDLIKRGNTSPNIEIETKNDLINQIIKTEAKKKIEIIKVNIGIKKKTDINIVLVLLKKKINMILAIVTRIKIKIEKVAHHQARIKNIKVPVLQAKIKKRIKVKIKNIITNLALVLVPRIKTGITVVQRIKKVKRKIKIKARIRININIV